MPLNYRLKPQSFVDCLHILPLSLVGYIISKFNGSIFSHLEPKQDMLLHYSISKAMKM